METLIKLFSDLFAGNTKLHVLAREPYKSDNKFAVRKLVEAGANVNARNKLGQIPLHVAIMNLNRAPRDTAITLYSFIGRDTVELLMAPPANVNTKDNRGNTPLHYAVQHSEYIVMRLIGRADPNIRNEGGMTPLHLAVMPGSCCRASELVLRCTDIDLGIKDNSGKIPQDYARIDLRHYAEHREKILEERKYDYRD